MSLIDKYPTVSAGIASLVGVIAASVGWDVPAEASAAIVAVLVAAVAWVYRRVAPVIKAQRGFQATADFVVTLRDEPLIDEILAELEQDDELSDELGSIVFEEAESGDF